ncbi:SAM-dependent methyltransferase [Undibacter mobilis]|uniref:Class I SAM-dependent methyltransferase n=1 Tax=Undibacter mobilis TaxID=2292256 RepID=A0A371B835_9BRAD|nr:cyclopropane-fatty-acyl-phospholipid synthase family protein [Undibacter mobilis]RDV03593.1 class I SAM-dependent methyltransferase [Undibacter mobilis]
MTDLTSDVARAIQAPAAHASRPRRVPFFSRQLQRLLAQVTYGDITIVLPNGETLRRQASSPGPSAKLVIRRWRAIWRLINGGELGFAEAYIAGDWWTPNLAAFLEFGARNDTGMPHAISGSLVHRLIVRLRHLRNRNTRRGSRRNIAAHYDLGNAFYKLWLDRGMQYSAALFTDNDQTLEAAQNAKLARILQLLDISGGERVLEIGCGWGALMDRLTSHCDVTGITLSAEQLAFTRDRIAGAPNAQARLQDYRDIAETFDRIVSIEMIEAVGERYWPVYFEKLRSALEPGGTVLLQAITIDVARFDKYRQQPDFIQRYIFPGGVLPTVDIIRQQAAGAGLELTIHQPFGSSYAQTLAIWRERFLMAWPQIKQLGFDDRFKRMWHYYLCYCEAGFRSGAIDVGFFKFKPAVADAARCGQFMTAPAASVSAARAEKSSVRIAP